MSYGNDDDLADWKSRAEKAEREVKALRAALEALLRSMGCGCCADPDHDANTENARAALAGVKT